jgi:hypothetical protein
MPGSSRLTAMRDAYARRLDQKKEEARLEIQERHALLAEEVIVGGGEQGASACPRLSPLTLVSPSLVQRRKLREEQQQGRTVSLRE